MKRTENKLPLIVRTARPPRRFPRPLHGWQQERDERSNNRDHHQQLDQRKRAQLSQSHRLSSSPR
jgi:hypothetical protein